MKSVRGPGLGRRDWLKLMPALAGVVNAQTPSQAPQQTITREMLQKALQLSGLAFTDAQLGMMLPDVNRRAARYELLRKLDVPLDTEPAVHFRPLLPGKQAPTGRSRFQPTRS